MVMRKIKWSVSSILLGALLAGSIGLVYVRSSPWCLVIVATNARLTKDENGRLIQIAEPPSAEADVHITWENGSACISEPKRQQLIYLSPPHEDQITAARISTDGTLVLTASADGLAKLWRTNDGAELAILRHNAPVLDAMFVSEGRVLTVSGGQMPDGPVIKHYNLWAQRRPYQWWGIASLIEFWIMISLFLTFAWNLRRDRQMLNRGEL